MASKINPKARILVLDIEWRPTKAYVWQPWQENIIPDKIIEDGGLLCVGVKWMGETAVHLFSEWEHGHKEMLARTHEMLCEADAVITYNGDKYDLKKLEGEFLLHGFPPPPPATSIDLLKVVKKFGFFMNRLAFIGPFLGLGRKIPNEGMIFWIKVMEGDEKARRKMAKYCQQDVRLTERLYRKVHPYIRNHPHLTEAKDRCGGCGSKHKHHRGYRYTRMYKIERIVCTNCGQWRGGKRSRIAE